MYCCRTGEFVRYAEAAELEASEEAGQTDGGRGVIQDRETGMAVYVLEGAPSWK